MATRFLFAMTLTTKAQPTATVVSTVVRSTSTTARPSGRKMTRAEAARAAALARWGKYTPRATKPTASRTSKPAMPAKGGKAGAAKGSKGAAKGGKGTKAQSLLDTIRQQREDERKARQAKRDQEREDDRKARNERFAARDAERQSDRAARQARQDQRDNERAQDRARKLAKEMAAQLQGKSGKGKGGGKGKTKRHEQYRETLGTTTLAALMRRETTAKAYVPESSPTPALRIQSPLVCATATLAWGDEQYDFPLGSGADPGIAHVPGQPLVVTKSADGQYRWLAITTTAYEDRDREYITKAALAASVARTGNTGDFGPLRWWHFGQPDAVTKSAGPGLDLGRCDFRCLTADGLALIESGTFATPAIAQMIAAQADQYELSPGFFRPATEPDSGGAYTIFDQFERSLVPVAHGRASNYYTRFAAQEI